MTNGRLSGALPNGLCCALIALSFAVAARPQQAVLTQVDGGSPNPTITIGGRVLNAGAPIPNGRVNLTGGANTFVFTNANGEYRFENLPANQVYTVTPAIAGVTFGPTRITSPTLDTSWFADFNAGPPPAAFEIVSGTAVGLSGSNINAQATIVVRPRPTHPVAQIGVAFGDPGQLWNHCWLNVFGTSSFGVSYVGPITAGAPTAQHSGRCVLDAKRSTIAVGGDGTLTVNAFVNFKPTYEDVDGSAMRPIYVWALDSGGETRGWEQKGTFTISPLRITHSVGPESGSGSRVASQHSAGVPAFVATFEKPSSGFSQVQTLFGTVGGIYNCQVIAFPASNQIYLAGDFTYPFTGPMNLNDVNAPPISNSQCEIRRQHTKITDFGSNLEVQYELAFKPGFNQGNPLGVHQWSLDNSNNIRGWSYRGTWTPAPPTQ